MQDRILGPLTMVQFIYAVIGGGFCYTIYMSIPAPISYALVTPVALLTICLVFVKVNERPFLDFLVSVIQFLTTPQERIWRHENIPDLQIVTYQTHQAQGPKIQSKALTRQDIASIAHRMDNK